MIRICLIFILFLPLRSGANIIMDSVRWHTPLVLKLNFLGPNYYGYSSGQNYSGSVSFEAIQLAPKGRLGFYEAIGLGIVPRYVFGHASAGAGVLVGKGNFFFRTGSTISIAFGKHLVGWNLGHSGAGVIELRWGAQLIPQAGFSYLNQEKRFHFDIYAAPHFILPTYELPAPIEFNSFWFPFGFSFGYILK